MSVTSNNLSSGDEMTKGDWIWMLKHTKVFPNQSPKRIELEQSLSDSSTAFKAALNAALTKEEISQSKFNLMGLLWNNTTKMQRKLNELGNPQKPVKERGPSLGKDMYRGLLHDLFSRQDTPIVATVTPTSQSSASSSSSSSSSSTPANETINPDDRANERDSMIKMLEPILHIDNRERLHTVLKKYHANANALALDQYSTEDFLLKVINRYAGYASTKGRKKGMSLENEREKARYLKMKAEKDSANEIENLRRESTANSTINESRNLIEAATGLIEPDGNDTPPNCSLDGDACKDMAEELQKNMTELERSCMWRHRPSLDMIREVNTTYQKLLNTCISFEWTQEIIRALDVTPQVRTMESLETPINENKRKAGRPKVRDEETIPENLPRAILTRKKSALNNFRKLLELNDIGFDRNIENEGNLNDALAHKGEGEGEGEGEEEDHNIRRREEIHREVKILMGSLRDKFTELGKLQEKPRHISASTYPSYGIISSSDVFTRRTTTSVLTGTPGTKDHVPAFVEEYAQSFMSSLAKTVTPDQNVMTEFGLNKKKRVKRIHDKILKNGI